MIKTGEDYILFVEPSVLTSDYPIIDTLTKKMTAAYRKGDHESGPRWRGFHVCRCGAHSANYNVKVAGKWTNSLCIHYLAHHREDIPQEELDKVAALDFGEEIPTERELMSPLPKKEKEAKHIVVDKEKVIRHVIAKLNKFPEPSKEMTDFYINRTDNHIKRVVRNISHIIESDFFKEIGIPSEKLLERAKNHDKSKYNIDEKKPYIWLTWHFKMAPNFKYPDGVEEKVEEAKDLHKTKNPHHPEFYEDPNKMSDLDIVEMVADWAAMSQEKGNKLQDWVDENLDKRWEFDEDKKKFIYKIVKLF